jgi:hypothetical protein
VPKSTAVFTAYGEGTVLDRLPNENYMVELPFGTVEVPHESIFRILYEGKGRSNLKSMGEKVGGVDPGGPISPKVTLVAQELYVFLRYHWAVSDRFAAAKLFCEAAALRREQQIPHPLKSVVSSDDDDDSYNEHAFATSLGVNSPFPQEGMNSYPGFILMIHAALGTTGADKASGPHPVLGPNTVGSTDSLKFEDYVQLAMGNEAYSIFSLDKFIQALARQLKTVADDPSSIQLLHLWYKDSKNKTNLKEEESSSSNLLEYIAQLKQQLRSSDEIFSLNLTDSSELTSVQSQPMEAAIAAIAAIKATEGENANLKMDDEKGIILEIEYVGMVDSSGRAKKLSSSDSSLGAASGSLALGPDAMPNTSDEMEPSDDDLEDIDHDKPEEEGSESANTNSDSNSSSSSSSSPTQSSDESDDDIGQLNDLENESTLTATFESPKDLEENKVRNSGSESDEK